MTNGEKMDVAGGGGFALLFMSILIGAATTGFVGATISYDYDTDPAKRTEMPAFYGYIRDDATARLVMFACLGLNSFLLLLMRCVGMAFMLSIVLYEGASAYLNPASLYLSFDVLLYLLIKWGRRDFTYFLPISGKLGAVISFVMRIIIKFISDFTGVVHYRRPYDIGGLQFSISVLQHIVATFVAAAVFINSLKTLGPNKDGWIEPRNATQVGVHAIQQRLGAERYVWIGLGSLLGAWILIFVLVLG